MLRRGEIPIFEPGLSEMVARNVAAERLSFTTDYAEAVPDAEIVFIAVGTPTTPAGRADLRYVRAAAETIGTHLQGHTVIVNKSTVPIGTGDWVGDHPAPHGAPRRLVRRGVQPRVPAEGTAVADFMHAGPRGARQCTIAMAAALVASLYLLAARPDADHRPAHRGDDQVRQQRLPGHQSLHQRDGPICERLGADVTVRSPWAWATTSASARFPRRRPRLWRQLLPQGRARAGSYGRLRRCHPQLLHAVMEINQDQRNRRGR